MAFADWAASFIIWSNEFIGAWGYLGIFIVSLIGNASIILPVPSFIIVFSFGAILNPWLVGIVGAAGATIGELTGYALGIGGGAAIKKRSEKELARVKEWVERHGVFPIIVFFAVTPLPDDIVGILGGMIKYDIKKFLLATFIGKAIMHIAIAWAGFYGSYAIGGVSQFFGIVVFVVFLVVVYNIVFRIARDRAKKGRKKERE